MAKRIAMYSRIRETRKYKFLFWLITAPLIPLGIMTAFLIFIGEYAEKLNFWIMDRRSDAMKNVYLFFKWDGVEVVEEDDGE